MRLLALLALTSLAVACRTARNYPAASVPRFAGAMPGASGSIARTMPDSLRLVTFNVAYARRIDEAIDVLRTEHGLRNADIVLLQEMHAEGTARIASALGMAHVYYPATFHLRKRQDFGNAVLSRWPIVADARVTLPHRSHTTGTERSATGVTIRVGHRLVRVYSAHLGTIADVLPAERQRQLELVIADAWRYPYVIMGGDMNSAGVGQLARAHGFTWLTAHNARTTVVGRWDHLFTRGFDIVGDVPTGVSNAGRRASDHAAVWAVLPMRPVRRPSQETP